MNTETQQFFKKIKEVDPLNNKCLDCGAAHPQWASVSHGCLICLTCSGIHRSLGVHISFIRSITMDTWTEKQMKMMELGGNSRLNDIFKEYGLTGSDIKRKYNTEIASYYRTMLKDLCEGNTPKPKPPVSVGCLEHVHESKNSDRSNSTPLKSLSNNYNDNFQGLNNGDSNNNKYADLLNKNIGSNNGTIGGIFNSLTNFGMKVISNTKNYAENTISNVQEHGIIETAIDSVKAGGYFIEEKGRAVVERVQDEKFWSDTASTVQNSAQWLNNTIQTGISGVNDAITAAIDTNNFGDPFNMFGNDIDDSINAKDIDTNPNYSKKIPSSSSSFNNNLSSVQGDKTSDFYINKNNNDNSSDSTKKTTKTINTVITNSNQTVDSSKNSENIKNIDLWKGDEMDDDWEPKNFKKGITKRSF
ncbi:beta 7 subunit of 20S proteasome [Cryptosporidium ryanae]|uniref:beta 7 subunit of 20S proteasome n=1 Tax=Cryptosporidium ryanae TaxID=515981 RepID=UPI00351A7E63|nr:beta 7 subunit of 20S proteasome [Cryptosporidium ryanae]